MLYGILDQHPKIQMAKPVRPEPKYFLDQFGPYDDYKLKLFPKVAEGVLWLGEKSTSYYETPHAAERIKNCLPDTRIIFIMRNPVDRALSNYWFSKENGLENRSMEEVFLNAVEPAMNPKMNVSVDPFDYLGRGDYLKHLTPYLNLFNSDQFLPLVFEEVAMDEKLLNVWKFLDLEPIYFARHGEFKNSSQSSSTNEEVRDKLSNHFAPLNQELSNLLDIDLSIWKN